MDRLKKYLKKELESIPIINRYMWGRNLHRYYKNSYSEERNEFLKKHKKELFVQSYKEKKSQQIVKCIEKINICPVKSKYFFYSIDVYKTVKLKHHILDNYSVDYSILINGSFKKIKEKLEKSTSEFAKGELSILEAFYRYYLRLVKSNLCSIVQLKSIESLFERPAESFFEGLQRILFFNQFLWQTRHKHNGLGHLDWILIDLYKNDIEKGIINRNDAKDMLKEFFKVLHENCWFKSTMLLGDTGQIIVLGGMKENGVYECNELTYMFIEISKELRLPEPKVLLRCSSSMPEDVLSLALECISTGIGAPFLSNDDRVIPSLISFGYDKEDAYNYVTAACWEPLIPNVSCDQNNICSINFALPFISMLEDENINKVKTTDDLVSLYKVYLQKYLKKILINLSNLEFEEEPLFSLVSVSCIENMKDIVRGGAKYCSLGVTTVGMGSVINSIINIERLVFKEKTYNIRELNEIRKNNFQGHEELRKQLSKVKNGYGTDEDYVINLVKKIAEYTSAEFSKYETKLGGKFKYGLSSPNYLVDAKKTSATFDGRLNRDPFSVHISSMSAIPATELLSFAMKLDYFDNRINGNVVDFFVTPKEIRENFKKYLSLLKGALNGGVYQLQMNVIDSATLVKAKDNPDKFPNLIVRVWGFSAYFNDLPEEYKDLLIERAKAAEENA